MSPQDPITRTELRAELRAERAQVTLAVQKAVQDAVGPLAEQLESQARGDWTDAQKRALDDQTAAFLEARTGLSDKGFARAIRMVPVLSLLVSVIAAGAAVGMAVGYL